MTSFVEGADGAIILDDRYAPLCISTFIGSINLPEGEWFMRESSALVQRQYSKGHRIIHIHDASYTTKTSPEMRKFWAEVSKENEGLMENRVIETPIVLSSALMRGVITAIGWLNPKITKIQTYGTLEKAISESVVKLRALGMNVQPPSHGYVLPADHAHLLSLGQVRKTAS